MNAFFNLNTGIRSSTSWWSFFLIFSAVGLSSCSKTPTVEYVVPNGYAGILRIRAMQTNGVSVELMNNTVQFVFPQSGILDIKSRLPSEKWHIPVARFQNGTPINVVTEGADNPTKVCFRSVGSIDAKEEWFVLGTFGDLKAAQEKKDGFKFPSD